MLAAATVNGQRICLIETKPWSVPVIGETLVLHDEKGAWKRAAEGGEAFGLTDDMKLVRVTRISSSICVGFIGELSQPEAKSGWLHIVEVDGKRNELFCEDYLAPFDVITRIARYFASAPEIVDRTNDSTDSTSA